MKCYVVGLTLLLALASACDAQARKWTDVTGKYTVEAAFVEFKDGQVRLRKLDGQVITVPLEKLSAADREHVRQQVTEAGSSQATARKLPGAAGRARAFPSFPDALTKPPAWIGPGSPFDVAKFLKAPPPDANAASLYLDALFEFSSETSFCFFPLEEAPQAETKRRMQIADQRSQEYLRFDEAWQKDPASVDLVAVDAWLGGYETGFEKLARAQERPACVFETGMGITSLLPHAQAARQVARVAQWRIRRDLARGDFERPIQGLEMVLRLSRDLRPRGHEVCQLVSVSLDIACCQQMVPAILTAPRITLQHCDRLSAALARHEAEARDPYLEATRVHYIVDRTVLHDLQNHTGMFDPKYMKEVLEVRGPVDSPFTCLIVLQTLDGYGDRLAREKYGDLTTLTPEEALAHPLSRGWSVDGKLLSNDDYGKEVEAMNQVYKSRLGLAGRTNLQRDRACAAATIDDPLRNTTLAIFLEPEPQQTLVRLLLRAEAVLHGTQCLIALRRWQLDHDGPPPDLDTMVKAAGMSEVPTDPYSDRPMLMTTVDDRPVIYSVGLDGKDDRALVEWNLSIKDPTGDLLFRLPVPQ